jgi:hypothetical protein
MATWLTEWSVVKRLLLLLLLLVAVDVHTSMNTHNTDTVCDPCTWQPPPVRVDAARKTIPKFSSKLKYGHESHLGARGQDGQTD